MEIRKIWLILLIDIITNDYYTVNSIRKYLMDKGLVYEMYLLEICFTRGVFKIYGKQLHSMLILLSDEVIPVQPDKIKDLTEEDEECEVYEDEDFVTVSSSLALAVSETDKLANTACN